MNQIDLVPETCAALDRIRHSSEVLSIYEMPADLAEVAGVKRGSSRAARWETGEGAPVRTRRGVLAATGREAGR